MVQRGRKSRAQLAVIPVEPDDDGALPASDPPAPPSHLGQPEGRIWASIFRDYAPFTEAAQAILASALEAHQRAREAREVIGRDGMTVTGRDGQLRVHPLAAVERDARAQFLAGIKALGLDLTPEKPRWDRFGNPTGWKVPR